MQPGPSFVHLLRLSDDAGLLEHARLLTPRRDHGYTVDDVARGLIAICREAAPGPELTALSEIYMAFLEHARRPDGAYHNRLGFDRRWADLAGSGDSHGRALWALGVAATSAPAVWLRAAAASALEMSRAPDGEWPRPHAFAVLGAAAVLAADPFHDAAAALLEASASRLPRAGDGRWRWPEARLSYDNARLPEALLAAAVARSDASGVGAGLAMLEWLVGMETRDGHFSFTPAGGWGPGEPRPGFDQQPVEAAAMADACARAWDITGDPVWAERVHRAAAWLQGHNDGGRPLYDPESGACADGLTADGVNVNAGAESTVSAILVLQQAHRVRAFAGVGLAGAERGAP